MSVETLVINTIRFLAIDAVERARSGHPGMPMGAAPMAFVLWDRFLRFNPRNPRWWNRDRFVLSAGHGSMLLYALLYLTGYDLTLEDLKQFRQLGSKTPGHPESHLTPGVEVTSGPLGQGFGNAVGMAIAEQYLAAYFNRPGHEIIDHYTYVIASDGDLMEGVSSEAAALAGHLRLGKLIVLYDDNHITIDGPTELAWSEDRLARFRALGWHTQYVEDGNDLAAIDQAIRNAQKEREKPSLIAVRTHIGYGSPKQDTAEVHGAPLGPEAVAETRKRLNWPYGPFEVPEEALRYMRRHVERGQKLEAEWRARFEAYRKAYPDLARRLERYMEGEFEEIRAEELPSFDPDPKGIATRKASGVVLNAVAQKVPMLLGGSADLTDSNNVRIKGSEPFSAENRRGRNIHFGVREHAMGTIVNGMAYHGGILPFGATFLVFSDYMRPAIRVAAMSHLHVIYVFTHDSIGLGEDGPTHQPIEQLPSLRLIPRMVVLRPADANEVRYAWEIAVNMRERPVALILTRQSIPIMDRSRYAGPEGVRRGAYVLAETGEKPELILMASGSEVHIVLEAYERLKEKGIPLRVVNMVSMELFEEQPQSYKDAVLPPDVTKRLAVEAARPHLWDRYVGLGGRVIGLDEFGRSAPYKDVYRYFGFTPERIVQEALKLLEGQKEK